MAENESRLETKNTRLIVVQGILLEAVKRANTLGKIMVDPLDVLVYLVQDADIRRLLDDTGINVKKLSEEITRIDDETPQGKAAVDMIKALGIRTGNSRSLVLDMSIEEAIRIADTEGSFDVTTQHLLAGLLRQGTNIASSAFRNVGITEKQLTILKRTPKAVN